MSYTVDMGRSIWRATLSDVLTTRDLLELVKGIRIAINEDKTEKNGLVDLSTVSEAAIDSDVLDIFTDEEHDYPVRHEARIAFIAVTPIQYDIALTCRVLLSNRKIDVRLFEDIEEAQNWLLE